MSEYRRSERELYPSEYATIGTKGRSRAVSADKYRTDFQRDIHRIIYSQSFRRLKHKTQVFYFPRNDHVTTRMDHVRFVASAARTVARCLGLNEDLAEAIGLAHDIGHAPFGHQGERFLTEIIGRYDKIKPVMSCFSHELYGLRVVDEIAKRDREKPGLNLCWEVRDGIISHCGEDFGSCKLEPGDINKDLSAIKRRDETGNPATLEGCIVRLIDKIAYAGKDVEDAIEAGVIKAEQIPPEILTKLGTTNGQIIGTFLEDMIENSYGKDYIAISEELGDLLHNLIRFNIKNIYHSPKAEGYIKQAQQTLKLLFGVFLEQLKATDRFKSVEKNDTKLPFAYKMFQEYVRVDMKDKYDSSTPDELIVLDFIAGMTDIFVVRSFQELFIPQSTV